MSLQFQRDQQAGKFPPAARYLFMPGMAPPNGGPDHILREATNELRVVNEVTTPEEARIAIQKMAAQNIRHVKMWVDDRGGTYPKLSPEVYNAIVQEAHARKMTVHAHAIQLADQKAVVSAGADVLVHMVQNTPIDQEYLALLAQKRPYWATVITLGDRVEVCNADPFFEEAMPVAVVAKIRANQERVGLTAHCAPPSPNAANRERMLAQNFPMMIGAGVKLVLATDTGIHPGHTFGSGEHVELARWVQLGLSPAQAIVAATKTPAELMGLSDLGTLAAGKRASFIVLNANPLVNIRNTRTIADVYLDGVKFDRDAARRRMQQR
jgi:imidazolonepropionase-like amidohydrolase